MIELGAGFASVFLVLVGLALLPFVVLSGGKLLVPLMLRPLRSWALLGRARSESYSGGAIGSAYPPIPERPTFRETLQLAFSRSTARDVLWLITDAAIAPVVGLLTIALPLAAVNALLVPAYWYLAPASDPIASPFPITSWADAAWSPVIAVGYAVAAWWLVPAIAFVLSRGQAKILTPGRNEVLAERVTALTASKAAALDAHAAELRRIERDLHDGAQNRLVSVVMMLGIAERSLETNPEGALPQLRRAREAATDALASLRTTVHDICPPILQELGLEGALSAIAGRSAIPCTLHVEGLHRVPTAVESASYFIVAEAVTNLNKHSGATQATISLTTDASEPAERLLIVVEDNGHGGATERPGGGIAGIRRRAEAFEGTLEVTSPVGGPTTMRVELPCGW